MRRAVKTSADDELTLLLAVGSDPVGDAQVVPHGADPVRASARVETASFEDLSFRDLLAEYDIVIDRVALAGAQDKVSLAMVSATVVAARDSYILKLNPPEFRRLVENEAFFLDRARRSRIRVVPAQIVHDRDREPGLVVRPRSSSCVRRRTRV